MNEKLDLDQWALDYEHMLGAERSNDPKWVQWCDRHSWAVQTVASVLAVFLCALISLLT